MEYETLADVYDAYAIDDMGYETVTDYIKGQNIKIKEIEMDPIGDMQKIFESKADGGSIGIEVLFKEKMANGGRVPAFSGGFLKLLLEGAQKGKQGIMELIETGKGKFDDFVETQANKKMFRSVDDIPPTSISQATGPMTIEALEAVDDSIVKKLLNTQKLGLYEETPEILKAANLLERFTKKVKGKRVIDYERAESILGVPLKGDETINDLFRIEFETRPAEALADGGRVGYNFSDQEIADALSARGLYTAAGSGTGTETTAPNIIGSQINQGRDTGPTRPTSEIVADFQETITNRQNKLNNPGKIASFVGDFIPQQRSIADMLASGQVDTRMTGGIPLGVGSMIAKALPDKYYDMSLADQITTQAYMGFTDPNTNMGNKDPFGLNVRSAFGNYAEKAADIVGTLEEKLAQRGKLSKYDQARLDHYRNVTATKQAAVTDLGLINLAKEQEAKVAAAKAEAERAAQYGATNYGQGAGGQSYSNMGTQGFGVAAGGMGGPVSNRTGRGRQDYSKGGLATMFTRRR